MQLTEIETKVLLDAVERRTDYTQECLWGCEDDGREAGAQKNRDRLSVLNTLKEKLGAIVIVD